MWAFGLLLAILVLLIVISFVSKRLPAWVKVVFWSGLIGVPMSFPYWHYQYPSYREFQQLCAGANRYIVKRTVPLGYFFDSSCFAAFNKSVSKGLAGFECEQRIQTLDTSTSLYSNSKQLFRFSNLNISRDSLCQSECVNGKNLFAWDDFCPNKCFDKREIEAPTFKYDTQSRTNVLIEGRLTHSVTSIVSDQFGELVESNDYTYYPYGDGFARILGMSSGSAPTLSCDKKNDVFALDFLEKGPAE